VPRRRAPRGFIRNRPLASRPRCSEYLSTSAPPRKRLSTGARLGEALRSRSSRRGANYARLPVPIPTFPETSRGSTSLPRSWLLDLANHSGVRPRLAVASFAPGPPPCSRVVICGGLHAIKRLAANEHPAQRAARLKPRALLADYGPQPITPPLARQLSSSASEAQSTSHSSCAFGAP